MEKVHGSRFVNSDDREIVGIENNQIQSWLNEKSELVCSFHFDPSYEHDAAFVQACELFVDKGKYLELHFRPRDILDYFLDGESWGGCKVSEVSRPLLDAMRAEAQRTLDRIDGLEYCNGPCTSP